MDPFAWQIKDDGFYSLREMGAEEFLLSLDAMYLIL
jgi:hypothetical protein